LRLGLGGMGCLLNADLREAFSKTKNLSRKDKIEKA
jgi:hypothetical protein